MSTRCNVIVRIGQTKVFLYRHYDGYLAETGADVLRHVEAAHGNATTFLAAILNSRGESDEYRTQPRRHYEITTDLHGDIEHVYSVTFPRDGDSERVCVKHAARPMCFNEEAGDWTRAAKSYSVDQFRQLVNADRTEMNARLTDMKVAQPKVYGECAYYEMV